MAEKPKRLTIEDWLVLGLHSLTTSGPQALRAERLARDIGATKGSFYWHFKDVADYKTALLGYWENNTTQLSEPANSSTPAERLLALANTQEPASAPNALFANAELAMRAWAREDQMAQETLARFDQNRINDLAEILAELDLTNPDFPRAIYATMIGLKALSTGNFDQDRSALTSLLATIVALAES
ncbi:TetR/AcrR family transcriptional regulator [Falsihalocynthiibacter sp. BN13B15]|uniref:TetR/AcrR family transcriptional regulator n=1 Tax=Falsihalocynthiibacter sp. BN13B15 TaxID=3240871 RepID=UPI00350FE539